MEPTDRALHLERFLLQLASLAVVECWMSAVLWIPVEPRQD